MSDDTGPPDGFASDPQLIMLWTAPPDLTGKEMQGSGPPSSTMPPMSDPFTVDLASLQAAQQTMLGAGTEVVTAYNPVEQATTQAVLGNTVFGQQATFNTLEPLTQGPHRPTSEPDYHVPDTALQGPAQQYAAKMNPEMTRVLRALADGMQIAGTYIAMINKAGNIYTASDKNSKVPPPGK